MTQAVLIPRKYWFIALGMAVAAAAILLWMGRSPICTCGEVKLWVGDALWFHFPNGAGESKLTPSLVDRAIGSPGTARNFNTVMKLKEMLEG